MVKTVFLCLIPVILQACLGGILDTRVSNEPPKFLLEKYGPDSVKTGDWIQFTLPVQDEENDPITFSVRDTNFTIVGDTISWRPAKSDTGLKTVVVYATDPKGGVDTILCEFYVVFYNHYHLVATLSEGLVLEYASIQERCEGKCYIGGTIWNVAYSKESWDNGDTPSQMARVFGYYDIGFNEFNEYRDKGCDAKVGIDSVQIGSDSTFIRVHQEDPCQPSRKTDDYYLSGLGLFHSYSRNASGFVQTNYHGAGESYPKLFPYVASIDSILKVSHK